MSTVAWIVFLGVIAGANIASADETECTDSDREEIKTLLERDANAPGKPIVGDRLSDLLRRCPDQS